MVQGYNLVQPPTHNLLPMKKSLGNCYHFENRKALVDANRIDLKRIK